MEKLVLFGDSIFDNAAYSGKDQSVIACLERELDGSAACELKAIDGNITRQVHAQLKHIPRDATRIFISSGGNDALGVQYHLEGLLMPDAEILRNLMKHGLKDAVNIIHVLATIQAEFRHNYRRMLKQAAGSKLPITVCTIYDSVPTLEVWHKAALSLFNDVIIGEALNVGADIIDLRAICNEPDDYAEISPIEPSAKGSKKIASAIIRASSYSDAAVSRIFGR
jgi:hypothetical protein